MADGNLSEAFAWAEKELGRELWPRERQFIETGGLACADTYDVAISRRPEARIDENRFDARLIRWLLTKELTGAICRHEGVGLLGLWIENTLELTAVNCGRALSAVACVFENAPLMLDAELAHLILSESKLPGLDAHRLTITGNVFLRSGFESFGRVDLARARIVGTLDCSGGTFSVTKGYALKCAAAVIGADVFLSDGFTAAGEVNFMRAKITGQLACSGSSFSSPQGNALNFEAAVIRSDVFLSDGFNATGTINFMRSEVTGHLICQSAKIEGVFDAECAKIEGGLFWKAVSGKVKSLNLIETSIGMLGDDATSWRGVVTPKLSGFRYGSIQSDMTVQDRLALLARKWERVIPFSNGTAPKRNDFDPQPYSQLAKVYDSMGHRMDAAKVRFARDERLMWTAFFRAMRQPKPDTLGKALACVSLVWGYVYRDTFGYGHAPFKALRTALLVLIATWWLADQTYQRGEFAPASPVVLASPEWLIASAFGCPGAQEPGCIMPLRRWEKSLAYRDYETFSPALYALDLFLPLDTLAQEESWAPSKDRGPWGWTLYWGRWLIQLSGWLLLTTAAAVFSGVLGKKD